MCTTTYAKNMQLSATIKYYSFVKDRFTLSLKTRSYIRTKNVFEDSISHFPKKYLQGSALYLAYFDPKAVLIAYKMYT